MKLLFLIVLAVSTVHCLNIPGDPEVQVSVGEAQFNPDEADSRVLVAFAEPLDGGLAELDDDLDMPPANFTRPSGWPYTRDVRERDPKASECKPKTNCRKQGGSCVNNREDCKGKILDAGCKGKNCYCCIPETGCPDDFFMLPHPANQCLKFYTDVERNWTEAYSKCQSEGYMLAKPLAPVLLREYMTLRYGNWAYAWLQARGDGTNMNWADGQILFTDSPMWYHDSPSVSNTSCLVLLNANRYWNEEPQKPYYSTGCYTTNTRFTLCQMDMQGKHLTP